MLIDHRVAHFRVRDKLPTGSANAFDQPHRNMSNDLKWVWGSSEWRAVSEAKMRLDDVRWWGLKKDGWSRDRSGLKKWREAACRRSAPWNYSSCFASEN